MPHTRAGRRGALRGQLEHTSCARLPRATLDTAACKMPESIGVTAARVPAGPAVLRNDLPQAPLHIRSCSACRSGPGTTSARLSYLRLGLATSGSARVLPPFQCCSKSSTNSRVSLPPGASDRRTPHPRSAVEDVVQLSDPSTCPSLAVLPYLLALKFVTSSLTIAPCADNGAWITPSSNVT